jgi:ribose 5-phosphate isomerase RpiB
VLCLGAQVVSEPLAIEMVQAFLSAQPDAGERHLRRIQKLSSKGVSHE